MLHVVFEYIMHFLNNDKLTIFFKLLVVLISLFVYEEITRIKEQAISEHTDIRKQLASEIAALKEHELQTTALNNTNLYNKINELAIKLSALESKQSHNQASITKSFDLLDNVRKECWRILTDCKISHYECKMNRELHNR